METYRLCLYKYLRIVVGTLFERKDENWEKIFRYRESNPSLLGESQLS
jgi:hypothetical protein